ncbi:MAG: 30S ribosomal protein S7 [Candidatus Niyogibacteria bacterium CG10_big_fil_rev_8_21_14_0_10_42_19]|uniref:Small ribosomal subunit protein uS7 n=1 Tax=Candidatus Niyogibacteria bacterium CG10_big_fil_rev_8_21_14_0_10_42_19 TaxID=1974725 RepID=A0A2H0TGN4_9BACT|nr:MAG: 30S ribosomal protein S7 [Candidatus Niyogibacteria bacterium CG10_big_fil_rev_8_21_14_0_10_42_19]
MRRPVKIKYGVKPDPTYNSLLVEKITNQIMQDGKKSIARKVVYDALLEIKKKIKTENPLEVLEKAIENISPQIEVRSRRVGGANYQVPREVRDQRKLALAVRWLVLATLATKGKKMSEKLANELIAASKKEGAAYKKKEDTHRMAEANRAFAHFAW